MFDVSKVYVYDNDLQQCFLIREINGNKIIQEISYEGFENNKKMKQEILNSHIKNLESLNYKFAV